MKKLLITGGAGTLGQYASRILSDYTISAPSRKLLDITNGKHVKKWISELRPTAVIHSAAMTHVDDCQLNPEKAKRVNTHATAQIARACKKLAIPMVYISTAAVFDGSKKCFTENDNPSPINVYGSTKHAGEESVLSSGVSNIILRIGWLVGGGATEKKFISYVFSSIRSGKKTYVVSDTIGSIAYAADVMSFIKWLLAEKQRGIFHFGASGVCSRYDIASHIRSLINSNAKIVPKPSSYFAKQFHAPRPKREVLQSIHYPFTKHWQSVLERYIRNEFI